jgi:hypothetical protein
LGCRSLSHVALVVAAATLLAPGCGDEDRSDESSNTHARGSTSGSSLAQAAKRRLGKRRTVRVVAVGDIACSGNCGQDETARVAGRLKPDVFLGLGDFQYERGSSGALRSYYDRAWGRFKSITYPTFGNSHDCYGEPDGECDLFSYFNDGGPVRVRPESAYHVDLGRWRVVSLPSPCATRDHPEHCGHGRNLGTWNAWLRAALRTSRKCTLAFWHAPYWSSHTSRHPDSDHDGLSDESEGLKPWVQTLYAAGVDVLLTGHQHAYERWHPMNPHTDSRDDRRGIRSFIVGTGGIGFYSWKSRGRHVAVQNDQTLGVLNLTLRPRRYDWRFVPVAGKSFTDSGAARCH